MVWYAVDQSGRLFHTIMDHTKSLVRQLSFTAIRVFLTSMIFALAAWETAPVGGMNPMTAMDAFPGLKQVLMIHAAQAQTLPVEDVKPHIPTEQETLLQACKAHGYGESCAKALLGMMWKESKNDPNAVGDHGLALGYFQIHYKMHGVTRACAKDLRCSAEWTIGYMESNGYPKYTAYAVQCHNGCNAGNGYAASALRHGERLWNQEVPKPVLLAEK